MLQLKYMRLNNRSMFDHVKKNGIILKGEGLILIAAAPPQDLSDHSRVGFIIRKSSGKAVLRNKIRRILRIVFQECGLTMKRAAWIIFNVPKGPFQVSMKTLRKSAQELLLRV